MKILVTGGAGFIGRYLVKDLLEKGNFVTIFDNFSNSTKESIKHLRSMRIKVVEGDITKFTDILNAVKDHELVIHLAAKISVSESIKNPSETFQVNVDGTKNVLVACKENHVKKLIVVSSAAVYGEGTYDVKLTERSDTNPISPYGESKIIMEQNTKKFVSEHKIDCIILRFFNIYGIGQTSEYAGVITKFLQNIKNEKSLTIYGDGLQQRDFVDIHDVIHAINISILKIHGKRGEIYNIASGNSISILDLAKLFISISGKKINLEFQKSRKGDIKFSKTSIEKAIEELNYIPSIELEEGLSNLLRKFNE